jgi:hypothetical protein
LSAKIVPTFTDRGCHVVTVTDPNGRILGFLDRIRDARSIIFVDIIGGVYFTAKKLIGSFLYHYTDYTAGSFAETFPLRL